MCAYEKQSHIQVPDLFPDSCVDGEPGNKAIEHKSDKFKLLL